MDDLDEKLLAALASDSSTSTSRLARRFKVARSTVQARIERLERSGVIAGYTVKLGSAVLSRRIRATVLLPAPAGPSMATIIWWPTWPRGRRASGRTPWWSLRPPTGS